MDSSFKIIAHITALSGKLPQVEAVLRELLVSARAEEGNLLFEIWNDPQNPDTLVLDERYRDEAALEAHRESDHNKNYRSKLAQLGTRSVVVLYPVAA